MRCDEACKARVSLAKCASTASLAALFDFWRQLEGQIEDRTPFFRRERRGVARASYGTEAAGTTSGSALAALVMNENEAQSGCIRDSDKPATRCDAAQSPLEYDAVQRCHKSSGLNLPRSVRQDRNAKHGASFISYAH